MEFSLKLHMEPGKTALLPFLQGCGCAPVQRIVAGLPKGILVCPLEVGEGELHVAKSYKHMGRTAMPNGDIMPGIVARYGTTLQVAKPLARRFFKKATVPI